MGGGGVVVGVYVESVSASIAASSAEMVHRGAEVGGITPVPEILAVVEVPEKVQADEVVVMGSLRVVNGFL